MGQVLINSYYISYKFNIINNKLIQLFYWTWALFMNFTTYSFIHCKQINFYLLNFQNHLTRTDFKIIDIHNPYNVKRCKSNQY
jgi:hypothetical protein